MSDTWYYVLNGERQGPVSRPEILTLVNNKTLGNNDYVWTKGLDNWIRIKDAEGLVASPSVPPSVLEFDLSTLAKDEKTVYIKIGMDRGLTHEVEYGPFSLTMLKDLFKQKRVNHRTFIYASGMSDWIPLGLAKGFEGIFGESPTKENASDKRESLRKPMIARMFINNNKKLHEGICRDISIGGMQVLVDEFAGNVGEQIEINVHPENSDHHFVASGKVVRLLDGGHGFSFRFVNLTKDAISAIENYLHAQDQ